MFAEATIEIGKAFLYDQKIEVRVHFATVLEWIGKEKEALGSGQSAGAGG
jgi:hypothetical protein